MGSRDLIAQHAKGHDVGLVFEPSFPDGSIVSARKGSANFTIIARGKAAHAGRDFHLGDNAITKIARFAIEAEALTDDSKEITVNIGHIEGGGPVNIVPDLAVCRLNVRMREDKDLKMVKGKLKELAEKYAVELTQDSERPPKPFDEKTQQLFAAFKECAAEFGMELKWSPSGGVCDGNTLAGAGLPTIDTLGMVGGGIHTPKEYAELGSLKERAKLLALFLMHFAKEGLWTATHMSER